MSDELNQLKNEVTDSVSKFSDSPRVKAAFDAAVGTWKVGACLLGAGLLVKPLLGVAFLGAVGYAGFKGVQAYINYDEGPKGPPAAKPGLDI